jgi:hypothetical protein
VDKIDPKIANIEAQINAAMQGRTNIITCPYCGVQNHAGRDRLCCEDFGLVVRAVLRKQAQYETLDTASHIMDNAARMGMVN